MMLSEYAEGLHHVIAKDGEWTIRGFVDIERNIYPVSVDTKLLSKILELQVYPNFLSFAGINGYRLELATHQNWYPDLTVINRKDENIKFAVDLKTTYRNEKNPDICNGFTLGSHGKYFTDRKSAKNIQYPYNQYLGHFCLGIIYSRKTIPGVNEIGLYNENEFEDIPSAINNFIFFAAEKWKIASDKPGSGNTANIGSIKRIEDILSGNGVFAKAGEAIFDDYWANYGKIYIKRDGGRKKVLSFEEYLAYKGLPTGLQNKRADLKRAEE